MNNINKVKDKIVNSFIELINKDRKDISITDLVNFSNVSRAAFYKNFSSIKEVVDYLLNRELKINNPLSFSLLSIIYKKRSFYQKIISSNYASYLIYYLYINIEEEMVRKTIIDWFMQGFNKTVDEISYEINKYQLILTKETSIISSVSSARAADENCIKNGTASLELMYRAGYKIFKSYPYFGNAAIIAGTGNNAGDGYVLAMLLKSNNINVHIFLIKDKFSDDGRYYFDKCKEMGIKHSIINEKTTFSNFDILVDAIFGTGYKGEVKEPYRSVINKINSANKIVISLDINSGLNGDNGLADIAVKSDLTISIASLKSGYYLNSAKDYIKELINVDIGIPLIKEDYYLLGNDQVKEYLEDRKNLSNKGDFGYVALIGGSKKYSGAIRLANLASSSYFSGAGVVTVASPSSLHYLVKETMESAFYPLSENDGEFVFSKEEFDPLIKRYSVIAIGMGLGNSDETRKAVKYLLENYKGILVIDADGLNALSVLDPAIIYNSGAKVILTPHLKEFSRLSKHSIEEINNDPFKILKEYINNTNAVVVLKGPTTIVMDNRKTYLVNRGTSGMATGGSGDVLSGIIAAITAANRKKDLLLATASAIYLNGLAGEIAAIKNGTISMTSLDTAHHIKIAINLIKSK